MKILNNRLAEIIRFCIAGGIGFIVDYGVLYLSTEYLGIPYLISAAISFTLAVILNYWLCLIFVFKSSGRQTVKQILAFFIVSVIGLGLNQLCMWFLVEQCGLWYMIAKLVATAVVTIWNYVMKRITIKS